MGVGDWFQQFCGALVLNQAQRTSFAYRTGRITRALNSTFRTTESDTANRFYVGSMGRSTAIPTVSDVDLLYELPYSTYVQFNGYTGNKQSALLSAVRTAIRKTYSVSDVAGDGQVVVVAFDDGVRYEVLPAFVNSDGSYTFADSNGGGCWRVCKPRHEMSAFSARDNGVNNNLVQLGRMVRAWRDKHDVSMSGMLIDTLAFQFVETWAYRDKSFFYYDYMTRDFFAFLASQNASQTYWLAPGSNSYVYRKGGFEYKARQAQLRALEAIDHLSKSEEWSAKMKFREIYGNAFPG